MNMESVKGITKEQIENIITKEIFIKAMVLVSPTYEGRVSDIEGISDVLHRNNIPLIVEMKLMGLILFIMRHFQRVQQIAEQTL